MEIQKVEQTEEQIKVGDKEQYILKVPYTTEDEYGNIATLYRKEIVIKDVLLKDKENLEKNLVIAQEQLDAVNEKINAIENLK